MHAGGSGRSHEHFSHGSDIGIRGRGPGLAAAFEEAALALMAVITDPELVEPREEVSIRCSGDDPELLLFDWINAIILEMAARRMLFGHFEIEIQGGELRGKALGEPLDVERPRPAVEVKEPP